MSGGSWDYVCYRVEDAADRLIESDDFHRNALGHHMKLISKALHDIEWVDSCDMGEGDEIESIKVALGADYKNLVLRSGIRQAKKIYNDLKTLLEQIEN